MIKSAQTDRSTLIIGAGLAGTLLAWRFSQAGAPFELLGSSTLPCATHVAAGVINPVTGRWMTKSWNIDSLLPLARETYREIEDRFKIELYHPIPELRFCQNAEDAKRAGRRIRNPRYKNVLGAFHLGEATEGAFHNEHGCYDILQAAYVDLPQLIRTLRAHFKGQSVFTDAVFDYDSLKQQDDGWNYAGKTYAQVVFCEGAAASKNPYFTNLPLNPIKGETLLCQSSSLKLPHHLYHHKKWLLSYPDGRLRIGATHDEADLSTTPTQAARQELLSSIASSLTHQHDMTVEQHLAGIRPASVDSRPILGQHPKDLGLFILNGLGSKGASSAPWATELLINHILKKVALPNEISLSRFDPQPCD